MSWYPATVTVAPASEPITTDEAKAQCRVDTSDEDDYIDGLIAAARGHIENYCGIAMVSRTVTTKCDGFCDFASVEALPLGSVTGITYVDGAGDTQTLSTDVYEARTDGLTASIALKNGHSWPSIQSGSRITVTATVGFATVPDELKHAALLLVATWFDQRAGVSDKSLSEVPHAVDALLSNYRTF